VRDDMVSNDQYYTHGTLRRVHQVAITPLPFQDLKGTLPNPLQLIKIFFALP
jgi:hypothetical protein